MDNSVSLQNRNQHSISSPQFKYLILPCRF
jgi:hypothetical protein